MATGGEVQGQCPSSVGSDDKDQLKCQPCIENGNLHEVVGMCLDCQDYLCSQCFKFHTLRKPSRDHQLLDKQKTLQNVQTNVEELETTYIKALEKIRNYRKNLEKAFDKLEAIFVEQAKAMKSKVIKELAAISDKYQTAHTELQSALAKTEVLHKSKQNCSLYIEMMKTKEKLRSIQTQMKEADVDEPYNECHIKFSPNQGILDSLNNSNTFGLLSQSGKGAKVNQTKGTIISAKHERDIQVKTGTDFDTCTITGLVILTNGRLVLADWTDNSKLKTVNVQSGQILTELKMSSPPWDVADITNNKVAVTLPYAKNLVIVSVGDNNLSIDRTLTMNGACWGVDFRNDKLAASFFRPHQAKIFNLQGIVFYTISADKLGKTLFNDPYYIAYGQDDTTLYVSNYKSNNVVCVKLDGAVVATYTDMNLQSPRKPVVDNHGNVYVCASDSHQIHQIRKECKKIQVLLTQADGLRLPYSICLCEDENKLYVGMWFNSTVKVFKIER